MGQIRKLCVGCGEEWPCWYSQNIDSYKPGTIGIHTPILENDEPELEGYNNEYD